MSLDFSLEEVKPTEVYWRNVTHNVSAMWREAGCYDALYNSDGLRARDLLPFLRRGMVAMGNDPAKFEKLNPTNGWGCYQSAREFLLEVIKRCEEHPDATVRISK